MRLQSRNSFFALSALVLVVSCGADARVIAPEQRHVLRDASHASSNYSDWSIPTNLGPVVNSTFNDLAPELSKDGLSLYFASNRPGGAGLNDIWVSRRANEDDPWGAPVNIGAVINTSFNEAGVNISRDGHWLYFTSTRPGFGGNDLYVSWRGDVHDDFAWEAPVNLGMPINSAAAELGPSQWGPEFYFWRGPAGTVVPGDIYMSRRIGNVFGTPEAVAVLNSAAHDEKPSVRFDGREIFFVSNRELDATTAPTLDIWVSSRNGNGQDWSTPVNVGAPVNTAFDERRPTLSTDGTMLFFDSNRPGGSGGSDLYVSTRSTKGTP